MRPFSTDIFDLRQYVDIVKHPALLVFTDSNAISGQIKAAKVSANIKYIRYKYQQVRDIFRNWLDLKYMSSGDLVRWHTYKCRQLQYKESFAVARIKLGSLTNTILEIQRDTARYVVDENDLDR